MYLARNPERCKDVKGIVTVASQATEAGATLSSRLKIVGFAASTTCLVTCLDQRLAWVRKMSSVV